MPTVAIDQVALHYEETGEGAPVLFVHGSVTGGEHTWLQQRPLAEHWRLVVVDRPGFGPGPPIDLVDFDADAALVAGLLGQSARLWGVDRVHLVGHSYGAVVSLLAAAASPDAVASLTVVEPPAFALAAGDQAVDRLVTSLKDHWRRGPLEGAAGFLDRFLHLVGSAADLPDPLPPPLERGAAMLVVERGPWEADIPCDRLAGAAFPTLVVSGAHHAAFDAVCDVLEGALGADRAIIPGAGHGVPRTGEPFNRRLAAFLTAAQEAAR